MNTMKSSIAGLMLAAAGAAQADIITPDPYALGGDRQYRQTGAPTHFHVDNSFDLSIELDWTWNGPAHYPDATNGTLETGECDGNTHLGIRLNGLPPGEPWLGSMHSRFSDAFTGFSPDGETQFFDTEMLSMDIHAAGSFGDGGGIHDIMIRCKPTRGAHGAYFRRNYIRKDFMDPGDPPLFQINSFFDIFTELSLDGGQTWTDSDNAMHLELVGPTVPAPGPAAFLALGGAAAGRRRRR